MTGSASAASASPNGPGHRPDRGTRTAAGGNGSESDVNRLADLALAKEQSMNPTLGPPAGQRLRDPVGRLHEALAGLAQRLRESVASVVGEQAGQAVRDGVAAALGGPPGTPVPEPTRYDRLGSYE